MHAKRFAKHGDPLRVDPGKPYEGRSREQVERLLLERRRITEAGCWEYTGVPGHYGYCTISLHGTPWRVHRLSWTFWRGPIPDGMFVCHKCDNRVCFNPDHLFIGTVADNNADMDAKGRRRWRFTTRATSEQMASKLTADDVRAIRASQEPVHVLAERYGISEPHVYNIRNRRKWADLPD